jgi:hypothetical protein
MVMSTKKISQSWRYMKSKWRDKNLRNEIEKQQARKTTVASHAPISSLSLSLIEIGDVRSVASEPIDKSIARCKIENRRRSSDGTLLDELSPWRQGGAGLEFGGSCSRATGRVNGVD